MLRTLFALLLMLALAPGCPNSQGDDDDSATDDDDTTGDDDDDDSVGDDDDTTGDDDDSVGDDDDSAIGDDDDSAVGDDDDDGDPPSVDDGDLITPLEHFFGASDCPTPMGWLTLVNPGNSPVPYDVTAGTNGNGTQVIEVSLEELEPGEEGETTLSGQVPPSTSLPIYVAFNCADTAANQSSDVTILIDGSEETYTADVEVTGAR